MPLETARDRRIVRVARGGARVDYEIHCGQLMLMLAKRFPDQAFDAIAAHRIPHHAGGDRQSKAGNGRAGVTRKYREESVGRAARVTIHAIEFRFLPEALRGFERSCGTQARKTTDRDRAGGADRAQRLRQSDACDLSRGAVRGPDDPLASPCGRENRGCADDADCSVGKYASCGLSSGTFFRKGQLAKVALKQAHAGAERRAARVRSESLSVKRGGVFGRQKDLAAGLWITLGATV